jgi:TRAP transporter TAXI family solute receptor
MKKAAVILMGFVAIFLLQSYPASAAQHAEVMLRTISAPFGTSTYVLASALEDIAKKNHPWLRISHAESPGYVFNMKKISKERELRKTMIVGTGPVLNHLIKKGLPPFDQKDEGVKLLATFALNARWLGTLNPKLKTIPDLVGKSIGLGRKPQINFAFIPEAILREGWGLAGKMKLQYLGTSPAVKALMDGLVDAAIIGGYMDPTGKKFQPGPPEIELMASGKKVYHIGWGEKEIKKTIATGLPFISFKIPAGTVKGQDKDVAAFANTLSWCAAPEFPDEYAYEFVKLLVKNVTKFKEYHSLGKLLSPELFPYGWAQSEIHPGALKAYKELKLIK